MHLSYDGIEMGMLHVSDFVREFVWTPDETTPLYFRNYIRCTCWLNPNITTSQSFGEPIPPKCPDAASGIFGRTAANAKAQAKALNRVGQGNARASCVQTDEQIVERLSQPRRKLLVWLYSSLTDPKEKQYILQSPIDPYEVDALRGPTCKVISVVPIVGDFSMCLELEFETHLPVCPDNLSPVISNRWQCSVDHNPETNLATHNYTGEAVFRMDVLKSNNYSVDQFRQFLMLPVPPNFQRFTPKIVLWPGGNGMSYEIKEEEQPVNFPGGQRFNATTIKVVEERMYYQPSSIDFGINDPSKKVWEATKEADPTGLLNLGEKIGDLFADALKK